MPYLRSGPAMRLGIAGLTAAALGLVALTAGYSHFVIALMALTTVAGVGLNVLLGLTGLISFGQAGFYAIGAYASAILTLHGVSFWLALPAAALIAALVGGLVAVPAMRVKGPYLAMLTIAFGFIVEHGLIEGGELTGGQNGLVVTDAPSLLGEPLSPAGLAVLAVLAAGASLAVFDILARSRLGRAMRAVRDADVAAAALGFDPVRVKTLAFAISAALTGLAGAVLPPLMLFIAPSSFPFSQSILFVLSVIVGGAGTVLGPLLGALVTVLLPEALSGLAEYRLLFFGVATLAVLWLVPSGLVGSLARLLPRGRDAPAAAEGEVLAFVGYRGALDRPAAELPHVDRRLVEIARALAGSPAVLLLDEPAAGLSRADTDRLARLIRRIADSGVAVVLVEHDMPLVMGISDHILVMDAGRPIARGTPAEIRRDPAVLRAYLGGADTPARPRSAPWQGPADAVLSVLDLTAGYGAAPVLDGVHLDVRPGETVALLGANGAGKSTAMRALAGLLRPVAGSVVFDDRRVDALPAHRIARGGLVLVPEGRQVFPELTVVENIRLGAFGRGSPIDPAEVERLLDRFPRLRDRAASRAGLLSGGEQQMLAIARGLMAHPRILLLDEPSLGLAPAMINALYATVAELRDEGVTILIVDQMAALALTVADRGYVLEQGRVVARGTAAELSADKGLEAAYLGAA
ncbi:ABC transporter [Methylobacterium fujisawaense]|uniref:ABC transporter permease subunit n=1 Tax=Methylobacterium fujisawaense TaxID=107400 RepID=UPI002F2C895B